MHEWTLTMGINIGESELVCYNHRHNQSLFTEMIIQPIAETAYAQTLSNTRPMSYQGATI